ncbi:MAG: InlB B-repeat-containing protein [Clostridia bacterium]|nr:InlB B-repeat-containing protein [Clostridia bacterium]
MKKITTLFLILVLSLALFLPMGCTGETLYPTYEDGFFVYYKPPKGEYVEIVGLTELGHQQKIIVVPETIGGYTYMIRDSRGFGRFPADWGDNNTLEKIYFEYKFGWQTSLDFYDYQPLERFENLKKVVLNYGKLSKISGSSLHPNSYRLYVNYSNYYIENYQDSYDVINDLEYKSIIFYTFGAIPANVEFMYNYEEAPNEGYYWIDDVEDGEKVEIIPPDPKRDGYTFCGWYTEPECENEWSFDTVINKAEPIPVPGRSSFYYPENHIYFIYANWIKN